MNGLGHLTRLVAISVAVSFVFVVTIPLSRGQQPTNPPQAVAQPAATQEAAASPAASPSADGQAATNAGGENAQPAAEPTPPAVRKLEIIELQHRDPQQLVQLLSLWDQVALPGLGGRGRVVVQRPSLQDRTDPRLAIALANEQKLMFVRGTADQIEKIKTLVTAIDVADDAVKPQDFADHRLIPIPGDNSGPIQSTLTQLELEGQMLRVGNTTFLAYKLDDEGGERLQQAEQVIARLATPRPAEEPQATVPQPTPTQPAAEESAAPQPPAAQPKPVGD